MSGYVLTSREGPRVVRERHELLADAVEAMRIRAEAVRAAGPLAEVDSVRTFEPGQRVAARIEISSGGFLRRSRTAGVDVMGDGSVVPFRGGIRRDHLEVRRDRSAYDAVASALRK